MNVRYFIDIINDLIKEGASRVEIAAALGFKKQNMTEILGGVPSKQRQNLKDEQMPGLLALCKKYKTGPKSAKALLDLIENEKKK